jgi:signal transduction histidine kinase
MQIRDQLRLLTVTGVLGLVTFAAVGFALLSRIEINGPVYDQIALSKAVVADYVPPSESLMGIALICTLMNETNEPAQVKRYQADFLAARLALERTYADYMNRVPQGTLRQLMSGEAHATAEEYLQIAERDFIPAVASGDHATASAVLNTTMRAIFERHVAAVGHIVDVANAEARNGEILANRVVRTNTQLIAAFGLVVLLATAVLSHALSRDVTRQTDRLVDTNQALVALSRCNAAVAHAVDEKSLLDAVCEIMTRDAGYGIAYIGYREYDERKSITLKAQAGQFANVLDTSQITWADDLYGQGIAGRAVKTAKPALTRGFDDRQSRPWAEEFARYGVRSRLAVPLLRQGEVFGILALFSSDENRFDPLTIERAAELGNNLAVGIISLRVQKERAEALEALALAKHAVDEQVLVRTAELVVAKERAESADRTKSAFLAAMSHELRTPLNSIIGFTDIALRELAGPLNGEQKKQLGMVQNSSRHLLALINDVLDISKIEAGQLTLHVELFDVRRSIERMVETVRPQARNKPLEFVVDLSAGVGRIRGDSRRVEQILLNLLSNAIKFSDRGRILVKAAVEAGWLQVAVVDSGIGISANDIPRLFQPFRQLDSSLERRHDGTGLGLSICKRLLDMMGGSITVHSAPGGGSTFSFRIPTGEEDPK